MQICVLLSFILKQMQKHVRVIQTRHRPKKAHFSWLMVKVQERQESGLQVGSWCLQKGKFLIRTLIVDIIIHKILFSLSVSSWIISSGKCARNFQPFCPAFFTNVCIFNSQHLNDAHGERKKEDWRERWWWCTCHNHKYFYLYFIFRFASLTLMGSVCITCHAKK